MKPDDDKHKQVHQARAKERAEADNAANLIRRKLDDLYADEPNAKEESKEAVQAGNHRSKHQEFMYALSTSGKSLASIQTDWHNYYTGLDDKEKQEVWDEFYASNKTGTHFSPAPAQVHKHQAEPSPKPKPLTSHHKTKGYPTTSIAHTKNKLLEKTRPKQKLSAKQHLKSLFFGLGLGTFVVFVLLFGFFNERFIAPFISPSKQVSSTPIIAGTNTQIASNNPEIIIPKINVQIPVVYDVRTIDEDAIQTGLERGAVHYATTANPGEKGNVVIFGHSSNNIFNPGKYKFAFTLLKMLDNGDTFYLTKNKKLYVYKVFKKEIVQPNDVEVLEAGSKPGTATLITCDPPGTSLHRLVVTAEQVSPSPSANVASSAVKQTSGPVIIPSNAPSLWQRIWGWFSS